MERTRTEDLRPAPLRRRFVRLAETARPAIRLFIDGREVEALEGETLLVAMLAHAPHLRHCEFGDGIPIKGPSARVSGLYYAFGFSGHGFQLGPGVGDVMAELPAWAGAGPLQEWTAGRSCAGEEDARCRHSSASKPKLPADIHHADVHEAGAGVPVLAEVQRVPTEIA